jgi:hypothetical protein
MSPRILGLFGALGTGVAAVVWLVARQWAAWQCIEGGRGADLLDGAEGGSIEVTGNVCRATSVGGRTVQVPLSEWQWDNVALVLLVPGLAALAAALIRRRRG